MLALRARRGRGTAGRAAAVGACAGCRDDCRAAESAFRCPDSGLSGGGSVAARYRLCTIGTPNRFSSARWRGVCPIGRFWGAGRLLGGISYRSARGSLRARYLGFIGVRRPAQRCSGCVDVLRSHDRTRRVTDISAGSTERRVGSLWARGSGASGGRRRPRRVVGDGAAGTRLAVAARIARGSAEVGVVAVLQVVLDSQTHRRMHVQAGDVVGTGPGDVGAFVVDGQSSAEHLGGEG